MNKIDAMKQPPLAVSTKTFHGGSSRSPAQPDGDKEGDALQRRLYLPYRPRSNARLTRYPSGSLKLQQNYRETLRLTHQDDDLWQWAFERKKQGLEQGKPWHKTTIFDWLRLLKIFSFLN